MLKIVQMDKKMKFFFLIKEEKKEFNLQKNVYNKKKDSCIVRMLNMNKQPCANSETIFAIKFFTIHHRIF